MIEMICCGDCWCQWQVTVMVILVAMVEVFGYSDVAIEVVGCGGVNDGEVDQFQQLAVAEEYVVIDDDIDSSIGLD